jgi:GTPase Era involved in 16S rRNA processing
MIPMTQQSEEDRPVVIVLLGVTGAGKSTFVSTASGKELVIGHGLDPCTQDPLAVSFNLKDRNIVLIDTPGFDDDVRTDVEILGDIAEWLANRGYIKKDHPVDGLILLHPATHRTVTGNERKRTRLLHKILGDDAYRRVIIATTMWENLADDEFMDTFGGHDRAGENGLWDSFLKKGSTLTRHQNSKESALEIIETIVAKSSERSKTKTFLNEQMVGSLDEELRLQLEEAFDLTSTLLREHKKEEPRKWRRSKNPWRQWKYKEWELEKQELERKLESQEKVLQQRDGKTVSTHIPPKISLVVSFLR